MLAGFSIIYILTQLNLTRYMKNGRRNIKTDRTGRVAVYLGTHCNIGWKRAFPTGILDR